MKQNAHFTFICILQCHIFKVSHLQGVTQKTLSQNEGHCSRSSLSLSAAGYYAGAFSVCESTFTYLSESPCLGTFLCSFWKSNLPEQTVGQKEFPLWKKPSTYDWLE